LIFLVNFKKTVIINHGESNMIKIIKNVSIEVTRRCNEKCSHCMRGEAENIDIKKEYIDKLLDEPNIIIADLNFSGGEPTLASDLIIYTIQKIIAKKIPVLSIQMTTNGLQITEKILQAFSDFYEYATTHFKNLRDFFDTKNIALIRISNDQFHQKIDTDNLLTELSSKKGISVKFTGPLDVLDDELLLTGRAENQFFGRMFTYSLNDLNIKKLDQITTYDNNFYLTATGFITTNGNGTFTDMDNINLGRIEDFSFETLQPNTTEKKLIK